MHGNKGKIEEALNEALPLTGLALADFETQLVRYELVLDQVKNLKTLLLERARPKDAKASREIEKIEDLQASHLKMIDMDLLFTIGTLRTLREAFNDAHSAAVRYQDQALQAHIERLQAKFETRIQEFQKRYETLATLRESVEP